jgi:hypothetical protein
MSEKKTPAGQGDKNAAAQQLLKSGHRATSAWCRKPDAGSARGTLASPFPFFGPRRWRAPVVAADLPGIWTRLPAGTARVICVVPPAHGAILLAPSSGSQRSCVVRRFASGAVDLVPTASCHPGVWYERPLDHPAGLPRNRAGLPRLSGESGAILFSGTSRWLRLVA